MDTPFLWAQEKVKSGLVKLFPVKGIENRADIATKILELEGELGEPEEEKRRVYEALRTDPESEVVAREWPERHATTTSPETQKKLEAALDAQRSRGGKRGGKTCYNRQHGLCVFCALQVVRRAGISYRTAPKHNEKH